MVYSDQFTPHTTADVSSGLVLPYLFGEGDNVNTLKGWMDMTTKRLSNVALIDEEASSGL